MMKNSRSWITLAALLLGLSFLGQARASSVPLTMEQMMAIADEVVAVRVESTESSLTMGKITTTSKLRVLQSIKSSGKPTKEITMSYLGGKVGTLVMEVPAIPRLEPGEEAVLFLSKPIERLPEEARARFNNDSPIVQSFQVVGGHQGKISIHNPGQIEGRPTRKDGEAIPSNARVVRNSLAGDDHFVNSEITYGALVDSLGQLAERNRRKADERGLSDSIPGIYGRFAIPERSTDPVVRAFDPLPRLAYASDEELAELKEQLRQRYEPESRQEQLPAVPPTTDP